MSLQIAKIVLYSKAGEVRTLSLRTGSLNILTGVSLSGKSAIIHIVDYCTGARECLVAEGVIRRTVGWYAVVFQDGDTQTLIARRNPTPDEKASEDIYVQRGSDLTLPTADELFKNSTVPSVEQLLTRAIGISENEHRPPEGQTRRPLAANFRHALPFSIQDQNDIDSRAMLFHGQSVHWIAQAMKDTLPYFLGAIDEDRLMRQAQLDEAKRELRKLEREFALSKDIDSEELPRALTLLDEAKQVGLASADALPDTPEEIIHAIAAIANESESRESGIPDFGGEVINQLRSDRQRLRSELELIKLEIRELLLFRSESQGYEREVREQRARLSAIGLLRSSNGDAEICPLCGQNLEIPPASVEQIGQALASLDSQLQAVESENPRIQSRLIELRRREQDLVSQLTENQQRFHHVVREDDRTRQQQDDLVAQAHVKGRISQYLEIASMADDGSALLETIDAARSNIALLEKGLDSEVVQERLDTYLNIIGGFLSEYSKQLSLEHADRPLRLDIRNLTLVADTLDGPVPLYRMGSGENWVGYHVLAHLALHKWFRRKDRPVPGFLILDQPSQAHYPPDQDAEGSTSELDDEDKRAVLELFSLIFDASRELAPDLQIIVLDHARLDQPWFTDAIVEEWRHGTKLIPEEWLNTND